VARFEEAFRRWAARPPRTSPNEATARLRGLLAETEPGRPTPSATGRRWLGASAGRGLGRRTPAGAGRRWLAAAAAGLAVAAAAWFLVPAHPPPPAGAPTTAALALEPAAVDDTVAVIPLDDVTVLYLSLGARNSMPVPERGVTR
jgi:hypothetical protein